MELAAENKEITIQDKVKNFANHFLSNSFIQITFLLVLKLLFQIIILNSGYRWLSADDFCRTVKSFEWLQRPVIDSGVWLTPHFWINGFVMIFIKDLFLAATIVNVIFSAFNLIFFYKICEICFDKRIAFVSALIFIFFPFQVWLSVSGLPESVFFCFVTAGIYYFLKWRYGGRSNLFLILSALMFAFSNVFRYEGWLFSAVFILLVLIDILKEKKLTKAIIGNFLISLISFFTIVWWLVQNYVDHQNVFFFAEETTKIFKTFNTAGFFQRLVQYPTFIFFIAPITTFFSLKCIFDVLKSPGIPAVKIFLLFNLLELSLLILQGILGTGGTNMISRYIVINALFFIPYAVSQSFEFKKFLTVIFAVIVIVINVIWSFYYPQPFREDTFEVGKLIREFDQEGYFGDKGKIYFEEVQGYFDVFAVQALSNDPSKFILGDIPTAVISERKSKKDKKVSSEEDLNLLELKKYLEKNNIKLAIVKSDSYSDKLKKLSYKNEHIGDYKLFYLEEKENDLQNTSLSLLPNNIIQLKENPDVINFNQLLALKNYTIDNTNFGLNPQTVILNWGAVDPNIIDSLDYAEMEYERYYTAIDVRNPESDSVVYSTYYRIFSDRNVVEMIEENNIKNIVVLKPFAILNYSKKYKSSPFEGGVYKIDVRVIDNKYKSDLIVYKSDSLYIPPPDEDEDTVIAGKDSRADTIITVKRKPLQKAVREISKSYNLGTVIAMFPDSDYEKIVQLSTTDIYRLLMRNGLQVFFSQRYQGDQFLNWVFNYF
ncbi:MAG TPA: glycosyltransferase family 39 protein [Ignavibacteria bacterium]|nr:glycosyltransferase family 39 protein [Ignavibacteria bacterium]HQY53400.1 glycosyltransferase family 39 protein [Ignavibacteria bacterium]HRB00585.1 glycosyltransferase family 39 protein [Ignavibacteria bacterium]